jgi:hypothetical protein
MNAVVEETKPQRRMLQPPKDEIRRALQRACDLIERKQTEIADLRQQLAAERTKDKAMFGIVLVLGGLLGATLTMLGFGQ